MKLTVWKPRDLTIARSKVLVKVTCVQDEQCRSQDAALGDPRCYFKFIRLAPINDNTDLSSSEVIR